MIIRNNLASAPTKNYSVYLVGCILLAGIAGLFTVYNIVSFTSWFTQSRTVGHLITDQQKQMTDLRRQEQQLRSHIVAVKTPEFMKKAEFINTVIKRRVFSWTKLFDQFERAFPDNVKMISVTPTFGEESIQINMQVAGKNLNDIVRLITVLENSPAFADVTFRSEQSGQDGLLNAGITLSYIPENASDQPAAATGETEPQSSVDSASEDEESYQEEETQ